MTLVLSVKKFSRGPHRQVGPKGIKAKRANGIGIHEKRATSIPNANQGSGHTPPRRSTSPTPTPSAPADENKGNSIVDWIKNNKKTAGALAIGGAVLGGAGYLAYKRKKQQKEQEEEKQYSSRGGLRVISCRRY